MRLSTPKYVQVLQYCVQCDFMTRLVLPPLLIALSARNIISSISAPGLHIPMISDVVGVYSWNVMALLVFLLIWNLPRYIKKPSCTSWRLLNRHAFSFFLNFFGGQSTFEKVFLSFNVQPSSSLLLHTLNVCLFLLFTFSYAASQLYHPLTARSQVDTILLLFFSVIFSHRYKSTYQLRT